MVTIGKITLDNGIPKICVPIVGHDIPELIRECRFLQNKTFDMVELRLDYLTEVTSLDAVNEALSAVRQELKDTPLLVTFRTKVEGGQQTVKETYYFELLLHIIHSHIADAIDVEYFRAHESVQKIVQAAKAAGVVVIMSNHDFHKTPALEIIANRLIKMKEFGADVAKIACMPRSTKDVLTLLSATEMVKSLYPDFPLITMSMGQLGSISRISGEIFGSSLTFGSAKNSSAPGQLGLEQLREFLTALHINQKK